MRPQLTTIHAPGATTSASRSVHRPKTGPKTTTTKHKRTKRARGSSMGKKKCGALNLNGQKITSRRGRTARMALRWWGLRAAAGQRPSQTTRPGSTSHDNDQINASNLERRPAGVRHSADEATKGAPQSTWTTETRSRNLAASGPSPQDRSIRRSDRER